MRYGGRCRLVVWGLLAFAGLTACADLPATAEITREHAIEIARKQVSFEPDRIDAVPTTAGVTPVWRVTLRGRLPGQPPELFETVVVDVDRRTGNIVSIARP